MDIAILILCACNVFVGVLIFLAVVAMAWFMCRSGEKSTDTKHCTPSQPKKELSEAEKERIRQKNERQEEEWNNFFRYTGDTQTKKGGD